MKADLTEKRPIRAFRMIATRSTDGQTAWRRDFRQEKGLEIIPALGLVEVAGIDLSSASLEQSVYITKAMPSLFDFLFDH